MQLTFNKNYFLAFIGLFAVEIAIAIFFKTGFIRHTVGDFLVVLLIFCFLKSIFKISATTTAIVTLSIAYVTEFLQRTTFLEVLHLKNEPWANIIFGNSFSVQDLVAYTLGVLLIWFIDLKAIPNT